MEQHTLEDLSTECPAGITTHGQWCQLPWLTSWRKDENIGGHDDTSGIGQGQEEEVHEPRMPMVQPGY